MDLSNPHSQHLLADLSRLAGPADEAIAWPAESWLCVRQLDALRWPIPTMHGGLDVCAEDLLCGHEALAGACLTSCFILSQRDAAVRRLLASGNEALCQELLPPLARGESFATVGLSQLTTSRQHGKPVFIAREESGDFVLHGSIPWVSGAAMAHHIVVGASLDDGRQLLIVLPMNAPGVNVGVPLELMALRGSLTAEVHCDNVRLSRRWLLAGPVEKVMQGERGGAGGLQTSCLALGLAGAAIAYLQEEARSRSGLLPGTERLAKSWKRLREEMYRLVNDGATPDENNSLRAQANTLVLQAAQAALIASKGTGFVQPHSAQRWARQALFFLVWSCPWPAASATLDYITNSPEQECL